VIFDTSLRRPRRATASRVGHCWVAAWRPKARPRLQRPDAPPAWPSRTCTRLVRRDRKRHSHRKRRRRRCTGMTPVRIPPRRSRCLKNRQPLRFENRCSRGVQPHHQGRRTASQEKIRRRNRGPSLFPRSTLVARPRCSPEMDMQRTLSDQVPPAKANSTKCQAGSRQTFHDRPQARRISKAAIGLRRRYGSDRRKSSFDRELPRTCW
jgi:hypothetical protein